jgi:hypothetical protein
MEVSGHIHAPAVFLRVKILRYPMGPRFGLDAVTDCPCREFNSGHPARSVVPVVTGYRGFNTLPSVKWRNEIQKKFENRDVVHKLHVHGLSFIPNCTCWEVCFELSNDECILLKVTTSRRIRLAGHVASMVEMRHAYKILVGKREWNRPLG